MSTVAVGREHAWLRPVDVHIDEAVQRRFDPTHANKIAKNYDPLMFGLGHVSLRDDGQYYALDGQHRVHAAIDSGNGEVKVLFKVHRDLTAAQEADMFLKLNANKKSVNALDSFNLSVKAGHPINVEISRILKSFGLRVAGYRTDGGVAAVVALIHIFHGRLSVKPSADAVVFAGPGMPESQLLSRTLSIVVKAWNKDREGFDGAMLKGIAALLVKHGTKVSPDRLANALKKTPPGIAISQIRGLQSLGRKSPLVAAVEYLEGVYNYQLPETKRLGAR